MGQWVRGAIQKGMFLTPIRELDASHIAQKKTLLLLHAQVCRP